DFHGQRYAEQITQGLVSAFGVIGFLVGFILQDIRLSLYIFVAGVGLSALLVIPAWSFLNKNPVRWLPSRERLASELKEKETSASSTSKDKST
ncbi:hypothetical protein BGZ76_004322, partial [Entomortierella beljakovae]